MDNDLLRTHLAQAERHVVSGARCIARQIEIVDELQRDGHDTRRARELLILFEDLQATYVAVRDLARKELGQLSR